MSQEQQIDKSESEVSTGINRILRFKHLSSEGIVYKILYNLGYEITLGKWFDKKGVPDFFVLDKKNNVGFWVEVKEFGGLSVEQMEWIKDNPNEKVYIALVSNKTAEFIEIIIRSANL